jgi:hypothetical protein
MTARWRCWESYRGAGAGDSPAEVASTFGPGGQAGHTTFPGWLRRVMSPSEGSNATTHTATHRGSCCRGRSRSAKHQCPRRLPRLQVHDASVHPVRQCRTPRPQATGCEGAQADGGMHAAFASGSCGAALESGSRDAFGLGDPDVHRHVRVGRPEPPAQLGRRERLLPDHPGDVGVSRRLPVRVGGVSGVEAWAGHCRSTDLGSGRRLTVGLRLASGEIGA